MTTSCPDVRRVRICASRPGVARPLLCLLLGLGALAPLRATEYADILSPLNRLERSATRKGGPDAPGMQRALGFIDSHDPAALGYPAPSAAQRNEPAPDHTQGEIDSALDSDAPPPPLDLTNAQRRDLHNAYAVYRRRLDRAVAAFANQGANPVRAAAAALRGFLQGLEDLRALEPKSQEFQEKVDQLVNDSASGH